MALGWIQAGIGVANALGLFDDGGDSSGGGGGSGVADQVAADQWNYYKANYQPLETSLIDQARKAGSPEEFARARGAANADVTGSFDRAGKQWEAGLQARGINPGSPAYQSGLGSMAIAEGATRAGALTTADNATRNLAYSKGLDVMGLGRNIPAQSAASANSAASTNLAARNSQFLQNQQTQKNIGYGLDMFGRQAKANNWFGPQSTTYNPDGSWGGSKPVEWNEMSPDSDFADGGVIEAKSMGGGRYDATGLESVLHKRGFNPEMAAKHALTPHMRRFAAGGGVSGMGMEPMQASEMGEMQGPGTETSDSIPAVVDGQEPAALSTGEFVLPAPALDMTGTEIFEAVRDAALRKTGRGLEPQQRGYRRGGRVMRHGLEC